MNRVILSVWFAACLPCLADTELDALRSSMLIMRQSKGDGPRGASQHLTDAKHHLRDWVESRFKRLPSGDDGALLERKLNAELRDAGLLCSENQESNQTCSESLLGFVDQIKFHRSRIFLILQTGVGIVCGFDESAYVYSHSDEGWRRVWQTEQNTYTEEAYKPQTIHAVLISNTLANDYVVLTLGSQPWCSSAWRQVYYRAFRMGSDPNAAPLINEAEDAYLDGDPPIQGSVTQDDVLVEVTVGSMDTGVHNRPAIRRYRLDGVRARRIDPLALRPRDFVDEWLTHDWREAASWSESANRVAMRNFHQSLGKNSAEFIFPTKHCAASPDVWQVGVDFSASETSIGTSPKEIYFLVRWQPPFRFRMIDVRKLPSEACIEEDREADEEPRTLFPERDWR